VEFFESTSPQATLSPELESPYLNVGLNGEVTKTDSALSTGEDSPLNPLVESGETPDDLSGLCLSGQTPHLGVEGHEITGSQESLTETTDPLTGVADSDSLVGEQNNDLSVGDEGALSDADNIPSSAKATPFVNEDTSSTDEDTSTSSNDDNEQTEPEQPQAGTIYVSPGESINDAIKAADDGEVIVLRDGRYYESINIDKSITIKAENPGQAIIDGGTTQSFNWTKNGDEWRAEVPWKPDHIVVGDLSTIRMGNKLKSSGFEGGFYYENGEVRIRLGDHDVDPNQAPVSVQRQSGAETGITVNADDVTVEGLVIRAHSQEGIEVKGGSDGFTARHNLILGSRTGIDMGSKTGSDHLIEYNEVSNYPLYTESRDSYDKMVRIYHNSEDGGIFDSETTSFRFGSKDTIVRNNYVYEMMDGMQPRTMGDSNESERTLIYNNLIQNSRDDAVEFDSTGAQNMRFHNNVVLNGMVLSAPSPINVGPVDIDHNLFLATEEYGIEEKGVIFKFDGRWSGDIHRNMSITNNTIVSNDSDMGLWWTEPRGSEKVIVANNIIDIEKDRSKSFPFPESNNLRSDSVGFQNTNGTWDLRLTADSQARDFGSSAHDNYHDASDGKPDAGAIEYGSNWDFEMVGPSWAKKDNASSRPSLPSVIDPAWVGLGQ